MGKITPKREAYYCEYRKSWVIPLTQGKETLVDAEDVVYLGSNNWFLQNAGYAAKSGSGGATILMHRVVTNVTDGMCVDHLSGNKLDNRKSNLRICTHRENMQNKHSHRSGKLVGTCYHKNRKKWESMIKIDGKKMFLGFFKTELEAHKAYMKALKELAGN